MRSGYNLYVSKMEDEPQFLRNTEGMVESEVYQAIGARWTHLHPEEKQYWNYRAKHNPDGATRDDLPEAVVDASDDMYDAYIEQASRQSASFKKRERRGTSQRLTGEKYSTRPLNGYQLFIRKHFGLVENKAQYVSAKKNANL